MKLTCKSSPPLSCHQAHSVIQTHTTQDLTFLSKKSVGSNIPNALPASLTIGFMAASSEISTQSFMLIFRRQCTSFPFFCPRWDQVLGLSILERPFLRSMSTLHLLRLPTSAFCLTDMTLRAPRVPFLGNKIRYESKTSPFERYFWEKDPVGGGKCTERSKI